MPMHVFCTGGHYLGLFGVPEEGEIPDSVVRQMVVVALRLRCDEDWFFLVTEDVLSHLYQVPGDPSSGFLFTPDKETWGIARFSLATRKKVVVPLEPGSSRKRAWPYPQHELARLPRMGYPVIYFSWSGYPILKANAVVTSLHTGGGCSLRLEKVMEGEPPEDLGVYARRHEIFGCSDPAL